MAVKKTATKKAPVKKKAPAKKTTVPKPISNAAQDRRWMAENDARQLADAEAIKSDPKRMKAASGAAQRMAKEDMRRAKAMEKIAGKKTTV